jgi:sulfatase modifying factor 1
MGTKHITTMQKVTFFFKHSFLLCLIVGMFVNSHGQTISNFQSQSKGKQIEITYDLECPTEVYITLNVHDKTDTIFKGLSSIAKGDIGNDIGSGKKKILLEFPVEASNVFSENAIFTVKALTGLTNMVYVTGGNYMMGTDMGKEDEKPAHNVKVNSFYISKYEITAEEYSIFCKETGNSMPVDPFVYFSKQKFQPISIEGNKKNMAIINVNWDNAVAYCTWLSKKTGRTYRLPTEAEWEFAGRGGNQSKGYSYAGSNKKNDVAWCFGSAGSGSSEVLYGSLHQVGRLKPNELGLYDMSGNAWEWCADYFHEEYYLFSQSDNPTGPERGVARVLRGGAYDFVDVRIFVRYSGIFPELTSYGFRVVCIE